MRRPMKCHVNDMTGHVTGVMRARVALLRWLNSYIIKSRLYTHMSASSPSMRGKVVTCAHRKIRQKFES